MTATRRLKNLGHLSGCDGTEPDSLTTFEVEGRQQAMIAIESLRAYSPDCKYAGLSNFGMSIGIRDTRKSDTVCNINEQSVRDQARFDDSIPICP